jgi:hypothetical protein
MDDEFEGMCKEGNACRTSGRLWNVSVSVKVTGLRAENIHRDYRTGQRKK